MHPLLGHAVLHVHGDVRLRFSPRLTRTGATRAEPPRNQNLAVDHVHSRLDLGTLGGHGHIADTWAGPNYDRRAVELDVWFVPQSNQFSVHLLRRPAWSAKNSEAIAVQLYRAFSIVDSRSLVCPVCHPDFFAKVRMVKDHHDSAALLLGDFRQSPSSNVFLTTIAKIDPSIRIQKHIGARTVCNMLRPDWAVQPPAMHLNRNEQSI